MVNINEGLGSINSSGKTPPANNPLASIAKKAGNVIRPKEGSMLSSAPGTAKSLNSPIRTTIAPGKDEGKSPKQLEGESQKVTLVIKGTLSEIAKKFGKDGIPFNQR